MKRFDKKRLWMSVTLSILIVFLLFMTTLDLFTYSRYETVVSASNAINTAIYLLNDEYQTIQVRLPDVIPSNNQYAYTFSVSNYTATEHSDTNLKYKIHIRTTTNMPIQYELFKTLDIEEADSYILSQDITPDEDGTYFRNIYTEENIFRFDEDKIDYYTILFTFPYEYNDYLYSGFADYIEINIESSQILATDD